MKKNKINLSKIRRPGVCAVLSLIMLGTCFVSCKQDNPSTQSAVPLSQVNNLKSGLPSATNLPKKVLQLNLCGNACWTPTDPDGGGVDSRGSVSRMAKVLAAIDNYDPDIVTFNEICYSQYRTIRPDMIARGYSSTYATTTTGGACDNFDNTWGRNFGDAVFSKGPVPDTQQRYLLPDSTGGEPRQLLCADTKLQGTDCKVCTTHLSNNTNVRIGQVKAIAHLAAGWVPHTPMIITGDFNAIPTSYEMGLMYSHSGGTGLFQEADESDTCVPYCRGGEFTFGDVKKIDYIFFSAQHFGGLTADAKSRYPNPITDHNCLEGSALWQ
jgi:endonuclease/exonuclease/phosphatase family metal-dependent hydrolase